MESCSQPKSSPCAGPRKRWLFGVPCCLSSQDLWEQRPHGHISNTGEGVPSSSWGLSATGCSASWVPVPWISRTVSQIGAAEQRAAQPSEGRKWARKQEGSHRVTWEDRAGQVAHDRWDADLPATVPCSFWKPCPAVSRGLGAETVHSTSRSPLPSDYHLEEHPPWGLGSCVCDMWSPPPPQRPRPPSKC